MKVIEKWKKCRKLRGYDVNDALKRIEEARKKVEPGTEEFDRLAKEYEQELKNKKLIKEMKFLGFKPESILIAALILIIAGFGFALDLDSPKAIKIAQFAINIAKKTVT